MYFVGRKAVTQSSEIRQALQPIPRPIPKPCQIECFCISALQVLVWALCPGAAGLSRRWQSCYYQPCIDPLMPKPPGGATTGCALKLKSRLVFQPIPQPIPKPCKTLQFEATGLLWLSWLLGLSQVGAFLHMLITTFHTSWPCLISAKRYFTRLAKQPEAKFVGALETIGVEATLLKLWFVSWASMFCVYCESSSSNPFFIVLRSDLKDR